MNLTPKELAGYLDATNLALDSKESDITKLCEEAMEMKYAAVCLYPSYVKMASGLLDGSGVGLATVAGFPHGRSTTEAKKCEVVQAAESGATEIDIVINFGIYSEGKNAEVADEIQLLADECRKYNLSSKFIVETCFLNDDQIREILPVCERANADYIKTSTGFGSAGAQLKDVKLWNDLREDIKIKASGGIRSLSDALAMIEAGADRLGVSAAGSIVRELMEKG